MTKLLKTNSPYEIKRTGSDYERGRLAICEDLAARTIRRTDSVIEFASNDGVLTSFLANLANDILALDYDASLADYAKENAPQSNIKWQIHDCNNYLKNPPVDVVVAYEIIEHLKIPEAFLANIHDCLKSDGTLLISTPNLSSPEAWMGRFGAWREKRKYEAWDEGHIQLFKAGDFLKLLGKMGFEVKEAIGFFYSTRYTPIIKVPISIPLWKSSKWPLNRFGFNLIVRANKTPTA